VAVGQELLVHLPLCLQGPFALSGGVKLSQTLLGLLFQLSKREDLGNALPEKSGSREY
jgi:hypothetical protein